MKKIIFFLFATLFVCSLNGQIYEPVKWTVEQKITSDKTAEIQIHATIDEGWHLYGLKLPAGGPHPTSIVFDKIENAVKVGDIKTPSKLLKQFDANFNMELNWYSGQALFIQQIKFTDASKVNVKGYVEFMACN